MAITADKNRPVRLEGNLIKRKYGLVGYTNLGSGSEAQTLYKGAIIAMDVSDVDGYVQTVPGTAAVGDIFAGIAAHQQKTDSSLTADGAVEMSVYVNGVWGFAVGSLAVTDIGANAFASDNDTITTTATGNLHVGVIVDVDATYVWVDISQQAGRPSAATT